MDQPNDERQNSSNGLAKLQSLLQKVKKTVQNKGDLKYLQKYMCDFEISQPDLLVGGQLKKYQLQSLEWMINLAAQNSNGILADDMGLGKTIQAISYLAYLKESHGIQGKHLIVCPKSVAGNWLREINKWFPTANARLMMVNCQTCDQFIRTVIKPRKFDIIITNYEGAKRYAFALTRIKWQTLIIDQAHKIKNHESQNFIILNTFTTTFRLLLTGTPLNNNLKELWALLNFIMPDLFRDENLFFQIEASTNAFQGTEEEKLKYQCQIAKYFHQIIRPFFKRRTKKELDLGLPQKIEMTLFVPLTKLQLRLYRNFLRHGNVEGDLDAARSFNMMTPRKICQHPFLFPSVAYETDSYMEDLVEASGKLNVLDKLLKKLIAEKHKILLFSQFVIMLNILEDYCRMRGYKFCRIDGDTEQEYRDKSVRTFYDDPEYPIFLLSTKAGGLGLNLVAADCVIIYDIDWNPQNDLQAADRAYRIGQTRTVMVYKLITEHSIEQRMLELQKYKLIWDELVIQRGAVFGRTKDPLDNINFNHLSRLGKGDIFHLEPLENEQTIEEILALGKEKNRIKQAQIRQKLKKTIEAGNKLNPFAQQQDQDQDQPQDTGEQDRFVKRRNYDNQKRQRAKFDRSTILPAFKFYVQPQLIKDIEFEIHMETKRQPEKQDKRLLQVLYEKLQEAQQKGRFHFWNQHQFELFIKAHQKYHLKDYSQIAEFIQSKTQAEVAEYSQHFFEKAPNNQRLYPYLRQIQMLQSIMKKNLIETTKQNGVKHVSQSSSVIENSKTEQTYSQSSQRTQKKKEKIKKQKEKQKQKQKEKKEQEKQRIKQEKEEAKRLEKQAKEKKRQQQIKRRQQAKIKRQQQLKAKEQAKRLKQQQKARRQQQRNRRNAQRQEKKHKDFLERQKKKLDLQILKQEQQVQKLIQQSSKTKKQQKKPSKTQKKDSLSEEKSSQKTQKEDKSSNKAKLTIVSVLSD